MKNKIKIIIVGIVSFISGLTFITYAENYNSSEISYDNSVSNADATNVKDAIDYLYSHGFSTCPEDMTCIESPVVTINSSGPGSVDKESIHIRINGSNKFTVTPDEGKVLNSITCTKGYTLSSFDTVYSSVPNSQLTQEITITNPNLNENATCEVKFSTNEIYIESTNLQYEGADRCASASEGCVCWYIYNYLTGTGNLSTRGQSFNYGNHTGCTFKSNTCKFPLRSYDTFDCESNVYDWQNKIWRGDGKSGVCPNSCQAQCSAIITCET